jgi:hypothetical protein
MSAIYVLSGDEPADRAALSRSIETDIPRDHVIAHFSDATYAELLELERTTPGFHAWGVLPGPENIMNWLYMATGDHVLAVVDGRYRYAAEVTGRYENAKAAAAIWGTDAETGESREYIFFLSKPRKISLPVETLTKWLPEHYEGLTRIDERNLQRIRGDFGTVDRFFRETFLHVDQKAPSLDISGMFKSVEDTATATGVFSSVSVTDARTKHFEGIIRRRGHPRFRQALMRAYGGKCAITRCDAPEVLEAVLIHPYLSDGTHHVSNGLLLRADLHTLFDLGQIGIDTEKMSVIVAEPLMRSSYRLLAGRPLLLPDRKELQPDTEALDEHRHTWGL